MNLIPFRPSFNTRESIRVLVRVRPFQVHFLSGKIQNFENLDSDLYLEANSEGKCLSLNEPETGLPTLRASFDAVFTQTACQEDVFHEVTDLILATLHGVNTTVGNFFW
eukprot:snap_masked-scaffold_6-processed-gene-2.19-mRNA-1 protein AED:0.94 eAED:1.00 QI:0/0/0/0.5/1/1/2/0/108